MYIRWILRWVNRVALGGLLLLSVTSCKVIRNLTTEPIVSGPVVNDLPSKGNAPQRDTMGSDTPAPDTPIPPPSLGENSLRADVIGYARQFTGVDYLDAGKTPETGFDCSGFTGYVMRKYDIFLSASASGQAIQGIPKGIQEAQPGDLVFFRRSPAAPVFHVALVMSNDGNRLMVVHSTSSRGVLVEDILASSYWRPFIDSVRDVITRKP
jgi:cell wall-associated NlpC family hydrolase